MKNKRCNTKPLTAIKTASKLLPSLLNKKKFFSEYACCLAIKYEKYKTGLPYFLVSVPLAIPFELGGSEILF